MSVRLLVCGDRNWLDRGWVLQVVSAVHSNLTVSCVIHGVARGADICGDMAAKDLGLPIQAYPALWDKHGRAAGPIRNQQMLDEGRPDGVIAFHHDLQKSKGTKDMVTRAMKAGLPVWVSSQGHEALGRFIIELKQKMLKVG